MHVSLPDTPTTPIRHHAHTPAREESADRHRGNLHLGLGGCEAELVVSSWILSQDVLPPSALGFLWVLRPQPVSFRTNVLRIWRKNIVPVRLPHDCRLRWIRGDLFHFNRRGMTSGPRFARLSTPLRYARNGVLDHHRDDSTSKGLLETAVWTCGGVDGGRQHTPQTPSVYVQTSVAFQVCELAPRGHAHLGRDGRRRTANGSFQALMGGLLSADRGHRTTRQHFIGQLTVLKCAPNIHTSIPERSVRRSDYASC